MRCNHPDCKKKLTLTESLTPCKCNKCFCKKHLFYTDHNCSFDYQKSAKQVLEQANKKIVHRQVEII